VNLVAKLLAAGAIATLVNVVWTLAIGLPSHPPAAMPTPLPQTATSAQARRYGVKLDQARTLQADRDAVLYTAIGIEVLILASGALMYLIANIRRHHRHESTNKEE
jgi:hypothetical protein